MQVWPFVVMVSVLGGCAAGQSRETCASPQTATKPGPGADAEIAHVLDDWHDAAAKADETRYFSHFAPAGGVFLGTDATERWTVPEFKTYAHPHFAKGKAWSFRATRRAVTFMNDTAWFDEDLDTPNLGPARGSGVLVREAGTWKIAQYNLSVPIPNERFKEVKALIEGGR
jgi:hypothetical protein